ncbi:MAG: hypothetical protein R6U63_15035 [Longimicrobiales bacterium]
MRWIWRIGLGLAVVAGAAGCDDESATAVGSDLLGEGMRTVQVVFDAPAFLQGDTVYNGIGTLNEASFGVVANDFGGELDANLLFEVDRPIVVTYEDENEDVVRDTIASIQGGRLTVLIDSLSPQEGPVDVEVLQVTEAWDAATVSWDMRVDSAGASEPWATPGGTTGAVLGTATWESGDSLVVALDSAAAAVWDDSAAALMGGALRITTPGTRLRVQEVRFEFDVTPVNRDTVVTAGRVERRATVVPEPPAPAAGAVRVGGLPVWRSLLHFTPLDDLMVPCETGSTTCEIALSEVAVSAANLLLWTRPTGGYRAERPMRVEGRAVLEGPTVPLTRSPLSRPFSRKGDVLDPDAFATPASVLMRVPITGFVQRNANVGDGEDPLLWLALTAVGEKALFGFGEFGGVGSATAPQLELVVTIPVRKVAP